MLFLSATFVILFIIGYRLMFFKIYHHVLNCESLVAMLFKLDMAPADKQTYYLYKRCSVLLPILMIASFSCCNAQQGEDTSTLADTTLKVAPESLHFTAHITETNSDGAISKIDTLTGYQKYYYANGKLQMEGKVTKASPKDYRDGIWNYYNDAGQLIKQEISGKHGKVSELNFMYFKNGRPLSKTYKYYEGDYKDKATFKFHKIETLFYTNGQALSERHAINGSIVDEKCWDSKGNPKPIAYLKTIHSVEVKN